MVRRRHAINPPLNIYKKLALSFIVLTAILLGVIFYFTFSYAYITIYPKTQDIATDFNFVIVEDPTAVNSEEGIFLGKLINQIVDGEKTFDATGTKPADKGIVGTVRITNNLSRSQTLVATTRLLTKDNVLYRLKDRVTVPAKGSIEAAVYPDNPNQVLASAGTKFTIPGLSKNLQALIYAEAINDFKPQGQLLKVVLQDDLDKAAASLSAELTQKVLSDSDSGKVNILQKQIISKDFNHKAGDAADNFLLKLKIKVTVIIFDDKPVKDFAIKALASMVPEDKQLAETNSDNLVYEIEKYDFNKKLAQIKSNINGKIIISENSPILEKDKLVKLNVDQIKGYLESFADIQSVDVAFFPAWLKKMPSFSDHIIIKINK
jgi:hypothetical protein